jgi:hypothetical protein
MLIDMKNPVEFGRCLLLGSAWSKELKRAWFVATASLKQGHRELIDKERLKGWMLSGGRGGSRMRHESVAPHRRASPAFSRFVRERKDGDPMPYRTEFHLILKGTVSDVDQSHRP